MTLEELRDFLSGEEQFTILLSEEAPSGQWNHNFWRKAFISAT